jgi:hypothetical protein
LRRRRAKANQGNDDDLGDDDGDDLGRLTPTTVEDCRTTD